ncbi:hypothetical protein KBD08_00075 [Candidatus Babeliales bacterium]|nr:hypothetical protein [Candidatus Babeliales bacterium]
MILLLHIFVMTSITTNITLCSESPRSNAGTDIYHSEDEATTAQPAQSKKHTEHDSQDLHDWVKIPRWIHVSQKPAVKPASSTTVDIAEVFREKNALPRATMQEITWNEPDNVLELSIEGERWEVVSPDGIDLGDLNRATPISHAKSDQTSTSQDLPEASTTSTTKANTGQATLCPYVLHRYKQ